MDEIFHLIDALDHVVTVATGVLALAAWLRSWQSAKRRTANRKPDATKKKRRRGRRK
jgi:hypothetical protein